MTQNSTKKVRDWWHLYRCSYGEKVATGFFGRSPVFAQNPNHVLALELAHLAAGYTPTPGGFIGSRRKCPAGIGGKDCTPSGRGCSLHNYGLAWDVEYNHNPHLKRRLGVEDLLRLHAEGETKYTPAIVDQITAITNVEGDPLFGWLGYVIGDTMHWQINVPPERQEVDWSTVGGGTVPPSALAPVERENISARAEPGVTVFLPLVYSDGFESTPRRRADVEWLQRALHRAGFGATVGRIDGKYGMATARGVAQLDGGDDGRTYGPMQHDDLLARAYRMPIE